MTSRSIGFPRQAVGYTVRFDRLRTGADEPITGVILMITTQRR